MSQAATTVSGLVSGIDWNATIEQLMQIERRRVSLYETRKSENETKLNLWAQIQAKVAALQGASQNLDRRSEFVVKSASSSDSTVVGVSASATAAGGSHSVEVLALAKAHSIASQGWTDNNSTGVGDSGGNLVIQVGDETITIADADLSSATTLEQLKNLINNSADNDNLVTASILNDGTDSGAYRLVLTADNPGLDHRISFSSNPTGLNFTSNAIDQAETGAGWSGTSVASSGGTYSGTVSKSFLFTVATGGTVGTDNGILLNWTDSAGNTGTVTVNASDVGNPVTVANGVTVSFAAGTLVAGDTLSIDVFTPQLSAAQNAQVRIDGIYLSQSTNTIENFIEGVTLDLLAADVGNEVQISIADDKEAIKAKIQKWVDAYNSLAQDLSTFAAYDEENESAAPLLGDSFLSSIRSQIASAISSQVGALPDDATLSHLADVGILSGSRGLLMVDNETLTDALDENFEEVINLFSQSFESGDNKLFLVTTNEQTSGGSMSVVVNYNASGQPTSATINGQSATIDGQLIRGAIGSSVEGLVLGFTPPGSGAGTVNTTVRLGKGITEIIATAANQILDDETGTIHYATDSLTTQNENLDRQIASWETRLTAIQERLQRQFSLLETSLSKMRNQSNYLSGVLG